MCVPTIEQTALALSSQNSSICRIIIGFSACLPFVKTQFPITTVRSPWIVFGSGHPSIGKNNAPLARIRRLLSTLQSELPFGNIFQLLHNTNSHPLAVCDGSVQSSQGTFGWVLATSRPRRILLRCSGPAYGAFMDSYRAESYGLLSVTTLLHLLSNYFNRQLPPIAIWCDNLAVVTTIHSIISRSRPAFPNDTLRPSWDIIQAICRNFGLHPQLSLAHVRGHQDRDSDPHTLPFPAQLNIQANSLATAFQHHTAHADESGPMIPGTGCHLVIHNRTIHSHHRRRIRIRRGHQRLLQYIGEKHHLSAEVTSQID
jgi:hypothetical protein